MIETAAPGGAQIPDVPLAYLGDDGDVRTISAAKCLAEGRAAVLGVPGAFTPVCTKRHIPDFIKNAAKFETLGFRQLVCIAPNDPFVLDAWARAVDPERKLRFLSDGNLEFTRSLALDAANRELFIGTRSERYLMIVEDGTIVRLRIEPNILTFSCATADDALDAADTFDISMV